jgi:hypothetical protein
MAVSLFQTLLATAFGPSHPFLSPAAIKTIWVQAQIGCIPNELNNECLLFSLGIAVGVHKSEMIK